MQAQHRHDIDSQPRLLAKVLRDLLATETFATYADLVDALKTRLARMRVRWTNDDITRALDLVGSNRQILDAPMPRRTKPAAIVDTAPRISAQDATAILAKLRGLAAVHAMPAAAVPPDEDREAARRRAWEMGIEL
jgi:hypothetical protein